MSAQLSRFSLAAISRSLIRHHRTLDSKTPVLLTSYLRYRALRNPLVAPYLLRSTIFNISRATTPFSSPLPSFTCFPWQSVFPSTTALDIASFSPFRPDTNTSFDLDSFLLRFFLRFFRSVYAPISTHVLANKIPPGSRSWTLYFVEDRRSVYLWAALVVWIELEFA